MSRPRLGEAELPIDPSKSVYINCPFDDGYAPFLDAIVFSVVCCGYTPRSAVESGTVAKPRLERITRALFSSRYSIHDLSRFTGEGDKNLARFNMPLELGMAMARRFIDPAQEHDWFVLVPAGEAYQRYVSNLLAYDFPQHDSSIDGVVTSAVAWLSTRTDAVAPIDPTKVLSILPSFEKEKNELDKVWRGYPPWDRIILIAKEIAKDLS